MVFIGLVAGFQSGLLGVGGGIIMVPAMVFLLGLTQHRAHGTSLSVMPLLVLLGLTQYSREGKVDWFIAVALAVGGVVGAMIGARLASKLSGSNLRRYFALFILAISLKMTYDAASIYFGWTHAPIPTHTQVSHNTFTFLLMLGVGVITGILSGLLGIGGGIIMIPSMVLFLGMDQQLAQGISLAVIVPVSVSGTLIHYSKGNVDLKTAFWIGIGGVIGAHYGALLATNMEAGTLRLIFGLFLLVIGALMFRNKKS